jgi:hypothetical protein
VLIEPATTFELDDETRRKVDANGKSVWRHATSGYGLRRLAGRPYGRAVNREHVELCASVEWRDLLRDETFRTQRRVRASVMTCSRSAPGPA